MFFIRGMVTGKWICFYAVHKVTDNVKRLCDVWLVRKEFSATYCKTSVIYSNFFKSDGKTQFEKLY